MTPAESIWTIDQKALFDGEFYQTKRQDKISQFLNYDMLNVEEVNIPFAYVKETWSEIFSGNYTEAVEKAEETLSKIYAEYPLWRARGTTGGRASFRFLLFLRATALELEGDWESAISNYFLLYPANAKLPKEEVEWMYLRRHYAVGENEEALPVLCNILSTYHRLSIDDVENAILRGRALRERAEMSEPFEIMGMWLPVGTTEEGFLDVKTFELYAIRDNCARVVYPKLHFATYITDKLRGPKTAALTRVAFEKFVEVIEVEYERYLAGSTEPMRSFTYSAIRGNDKKQNLETAKEVIELLRKMKDLPF
ncbi:MAG: hypothetical protein ACOX0A_06095 [Thermoguttaceae bacterium]